MVLIVITVGITELYNSILKIENELIVIWHFSYLRCFDI